MRNQRFNAKLIALRISPSFSLDKVVIRDPMFDFETVCMYAVTSSGQSDERRF